MREVQQEPGRTVARESGIAWFFKLLVLALLAIAAVLAAFNHDRLHVYEPYFRSSAPEIRMRYELLSGTMDEAAVRQHFSSVSLSCVPQNPGGNSLGDRVCYAGLEKADGNPALGIALFFNKGRLSHSLVQIPWWRHLQQKMRLLATYGAGSPHEKSGEAVMMTWRMPNGVLYFNRDHTSVLNPLVWSIVRWSSNQTVR